ncbi:DUF4956 domain-containing protein [Actinomyces minihominis]|uniref:DUF4956 domain-containing protein n=1 Tax=Actinomyces minihominis TaxID=2002838 RepID=UPI000C07A9B4|nr:DUF4956 domain-containing protein [Actinomyces minihominis]
MDWTFLVADLVLISILVLGLYRRRHGRKDLVIALYGSNVGVMIVAFALQDVSATTSVGVGLGLFGVLSIIRLRSTELEQYDVAYYFSALAMGLLAGLNVGVWWVSCGLMALPILILGLVDSPHFMPGSRRQRVTLDEAVCREGLLRAQLTEILQAQVTQISVVQTDLVQDKTIVDVVYRVNPRTVEKQSAPASGYSPDVVSHA